MEVKLILARNAESSLRNSGITGEKTKNIGVGTRRIVYELVFTNWVRQVRKFVTVSAASDFVLSRLISFFQKPRVRFTAHADSFSRAEAFVG